MMISKFLILQSLSLLLISSAKADLGGISSDCTPDQPINLCEISKERRSESPSLKINCRPTLVSAARAVKELCATASEELSECLAKLNSTAASGEIGSNTQDSATDSIKLMKSQSSEMSAQFAICKKISDEGSKDCNEGLRETRAVLNKYASNPGKFCDSANKVNQARQSLEAANQSGQMMKSSLTTAEAKLDSSNAVVNSLESQSVQTQNGTSAAGTETNSPEYDPTERTVAGKTEVHPTHGGGSIEISTGGGTGTATLFDPNGNETGTFLFNPLTGEQK